MNHQQWKVCTYEIPYLSIFEFYFYVLQSYIKVSKMSPIVSVFWALLKQQNFKARY